MKSYKTKAPSPGLVFSNPSLLFCTFFGAGCITPAPGTWGSFAAWVAFWLMTQAVDRSFIWLFAIICFVTAVFAIPKCEKFLGKMDHGSIVIDEVVAVWLVLLLTPVGFFWQLASVLAFRFFDIVKLPPASSLDNGKQSGWTVMIDDIFAGLYAVIVINAAAYVFMNVMDAQLAWKFF